MRFNLGELLLAQRTRTVTTEFPPSWQSRLWSELSPRHIPCFSRRRWTSCRSTGRPWDRGRVWRRLPGSVATWPPEPVYASQQTPNSLPPRTHDRFNHVIPRATKVCRYNWHSAGSLGWPFPMLKYKYIKYKRNFEIKYISFRVLFDQIASVHFIR